MKILSVNDKHDYQKIWERDRSSVLQSWYWGEFKGGHDGAIRAILGKHTVTIFIKTVPIFGWRFGYMPHGGPKKLFTKENASELAKLARENNLSHIVIDPFVQKYDAEIPAEYFPATGLPSVQTQQTLLTDLVENEEEMLSRMRKKHRQYIRKSERKGLKFETDDSLNGVKRLAAVLEKQHSTKNYIAHPAVYYEKLWNAFEGTGMVHVHIVHKDGSDVGAYMVLDGYDRVFQFYGGTTKLGRELYGAYLLTWRSMLAARDRGFKLYDQWGISPYDEDGEFDSSDEKYGISVFKEGFSGQKITYADQVAVINDKSRYTLYRQLIKFHKSLIGLRKHSR